MPFPEPNLAYVEARIAEFDGDDRFYGAERAVGLTFRQWPANTELDHVLVKVIVLNRLYSTNVYDVWSLARHIVDLNIDPRLHQGDDRLIDAIANVKFAEKARYLLSFATKYCSWHQPEKYQIFDSYVECILWEYQKQFGFGSFSRYELRDYPRFVQIIDQLRNRFNLSSLSKKQLDKFLWIEGRNASEAVTAEAFVSNSKIVGADQLLAFIASRETDEWLTRVKKESFRVSVGPSGFLFTPGSGKSRAVSLSEIESFCLRFNEHQSFKTTEYHDTWHSSYMLTLIDRFLTESNPSV